MRQKKLFICFLFALISLFIVNNILAQADITLNHRWLNTFDRNPASIENSEFLNIDVMTRNQWIDFKGGPSAQLLTATAFLDEYNAGAGLVVMNDKIGYVNTFSFKIAYAYQLQLNPNLFCSFGVSAGFINKSVDKSDMDALEDYDPRLARLKGSRFSPDIDLGTEIIHPVFRFGASITHLATLLDRKDILGTITNKYVYLVFNIKPFEQLSVSPAVYYRNRQNINRIEVNSLFYWYNKGLHGRQLFWFGGGYKFGINDAAFMAGVNITENIAVGYNYEANFGKVGKHSSGTHECILRVKLKVTEPTKPTSVTIARDYWNNKIKKLK